jgi:hypothetical protein
MAYSQVIQSASLAGREINRMDRMKTKEKGKR